MNNKFNETDTHFRKIYLSVPKSDIKFSPVEISPNERYYYLGKIQKKPIILKEHAGLVLILVYEAKKAIQRNKILSDLWAKHL
jgi:hypothetical protein